MNADESNPDAMPWPIAGDKLFATDADWWHNACLNFARNKWDAYATGYKDAADIIVDRVIETRQAMDTLIYPVAFLYRHYSITADAPPPTSASSVVAPASVHC